MMSFGTFLLRLTLVSAIPALLLLSFTWFPPLQRHTGFGFFCLLIFIAMSVGIFFPFRMAARSKNPLLFTQLSLVFILFKLLFSAILILVYHRMYQPGDRWFLLPFGAVYLVYTVFEMWVLGQLGHQGARPEPSIRESGSV